MLASAVWIRVSTPTPPTPHVWGTNAPPVSLHFTNIEATTTFRIFRRRTDNYWNDGSPYASTEGVALLRALETSKRWDGKSHGGAYGLLHAHTPGIEIKVDWSRTKEERQTHSVALCSGNRLFWYGDEIYQIPEPSYGVVDRLFPENK